MSSGTNGSLMTFPVDRPLERKRLNLSEEDKDMIVNEISLVIQNIISIFSYQDNFFSLFGLWRNQFHLFLICYILSVMKFIYFTIYNFSIGIFLKSYGYLSFLSFTICILFHSRHTSFHCGFYFSYLKRHRIRNRKRKPSIFKFSCFLELNC